MPVRWEAGTAPTPTHTTNQIKPTHESNMIFTTLAIIATTALTTSATGAATWQLYKTCMPWISPREEVIAREALATSDDSVMVCDGISDNLIDVMEGEVLSEETAVVLYQPGRHDPGRQGNVSHAAVPVLGAGRFVGACVMSAKVVFGTPTDDRANRLVVRKFLRDLMEEHGMRPTHIMKFLDMATELVFIPSASELHAARLRNSRAWKLRSAAYRQATSMGMRKTFWEFITRGAVRSDRAA